MMRQRSFGRVPSGGSLNSTSNARTHKESYQDFNEKGSQKGIAPSIWALIVLSAVLGIVCLYLFQTNISLSSVASEMKLSLIDESARQIKEMSDRLAELSLKNEKIKARLETEEYDKDQLQARTNNLEGRVARLKNKVKRLEAKVDGTLENRRIEVETSMAQYRWGTGNVYVEVRTDYGSFRMKMAPFTLMPHTTSWFLSLAEAGYWEGCGFVRNAVHVLQANCNPKKSTGNDLAPITIAYQEYNDAWQHKDYTFGIAGRPGGPDFYINLIDNSGRHGPGGQARPEADPCFAELVSGKDVIKEMHKLEHDKTSFKGLINPVIFRSVTVVTEEDDLAA